MIVRQSTDRTILVGPILDSAGVAKTDEVVASIKVTKNGTVGAINGSATLTHDHTGKYRLAYTATDSDTVGVLEFSLNSGTNDMPIARLVVMEEVTYDALFAANANAWTGAAGSSIGTTVGSVATVTGSVGSVVGAVGSVTGAVGSVTGAVGSVTGAVGSVAGNVGGNVVGSVGSVVGHTPQTGDAYAVVNSGTHGNAAIKGYVDDIGVAGAGLTGIPGLSDPHAVSLPGSYDPGTAGYIIGNFLDAAISSRMQTGEHVTLLDSSVTDAKFYLPAVVSGPATGFISRLMQLWRRFCMKHADDKVNDKIRTYADDGTTILTEQSYTEGTTDTVGPMVAP